MEEEPGGPKAPRQIENKVKGDIGFLRNITYILDLYVPKIMEMFLEFVGGADPNRPTSPPTSGPSRPGETGANGSDDGEGSIGPSGPGIPPM